MTITLTPVPLDSIERRFSFDIAGAPPIAFPGALADVAPDMVNVTEVIVGQRRSVVFTFGAPPDLEVTYVWPKPALRPDVRTLPAELLEAVLAAAGITLDD